MKGRGGNEGETVGWKRWRRRGVGGGGIQREGRRMRGRMMGSEPVVLEIKKVRGGGGAGEMKEERRRRRKG